MSWPLAVSREFLERALSQARSRQDARALGVRICEVMELQELEELRMLRTPEYPQNNQTPIGPPVAPARRARQLDRALRGRR